MYLFFLNNMQSNAVRITSFLKKKNVFIYINVQSHFVSCIASSHKTLLKYMLEYRTIENYCAVTTVVVIMLSVKVNIASLF